MTDSLQQTISREFVVYKYGIYLIMPLFLNDAALLISVRKQKLFLIKIRFNYQTGKKGKLSINMKLIE
ncbi:hypothetical protein D3Z50_01295 [Clostridiaceae bacterium]|nr:hypothetical protein [Clostridiaceae bacterium]